MAKYACLDSDGVIQNIIVADETPNLPEYAGVLDWEAGMDIGKKKIDGAWTDTSMVLYVSLDKSETVVGEKVMATAVVANRDRSITHDMTGIYYVPVIRRSDGRQVAFLEVEFVHGQASVEFSISAVGVFTIDLSKVYPRPQSELGESPNLIVKPQ